MKQELTFKSQARIVRTLGDRLISGEVAAILELVKNAYDADAKSCYIEINPEKNVLIIKDDGQGMSLSDVQSKWAELGTDNKFRNSVSNAGRKVLGDKGIGRLAAAKLGRYLEINSTTQNKGKLDSIVIGGIDWDAFSEKNNAYIDDIKFHVEDFKGGEATGTTLTISELTQVWNQEKIETLIRELRKFMSPISQDDNDFEIFLNLDAFTKDSAGFDGSDLVNGRATTVSSVKRGEETARNKIEPFPLLDASDYTFEASYYSNKLSGKLKINDTKVDHEIEVVLDDSINLGEGLIQLSIFDRDADSVRNTFVQAGIYSEDDKKKFSLREARRALDDLSGIAIYRNNFRIRPYGDKDADWLSLDKRRVQNPSKHLEQAQISGLILVDSVEKSGLIERSSREGFEHNDQYNNFKQLLISALNEIEVLRFAHNSRIGKNRKKPGDDVKSAFTTLSEQVDLKKISGFYDDVAEEKRGKFQKTVNNYKNRLDHLIQIIQERQSILEARSTLGFIAADIVHEARHPTSVIGTDLILLSDQVKDNWQDDISKNVSEVLLQSFKQDLEQVESLEFLFDKLDPLTKARSKKPSEFSVYEVIKKSLLVHQKKARDFSIKIQHDQPEKDHKMNGFEDDLSPAIINLVDNALYWHKQRAIKKPFIKISYIEDHSGALVISVEDNAGGISEKYKDAIFNVGFTTKENGSGLGLSIAREALGRAGAYISHENSDDKSGSIFIIEVKRDM
jgi:signal transduction histidine kinase